MPMIKSELTNYLPESLRGNNIDKMLQIFDTTTSNLRGSLADLLAIRNLDTAYGVYLDILGEGLGIHRNGMTDGEYREIIRTHRVSYLSKGELHTIASVAKAIFGDNYQSVIEAWNQPAYGNEDATVYVNINKKWKDETEEQTNTIDTLQRVKAGGVKLEMASLNTWGSIYEDNATWGDVFANYKNWGEVYGFIDRSDK